MGTPEPHPVRIGTAEREQAVQLLGEHFAQGRLEPDEFEERMTAAYAARTTAELDVLFHDLPGLHRPTAPYPAPLRPPHPGPPTPPFGGAPAPRPASHPPGYDPQAPYGREPRTGLPYSDRSQIVAGVLQILVPFGIGRFYSGHIGIGVAQLVLSFVGIGMVWAFIDGILVLAGHPTDRHGRPLRP